MIALLVDSLKLADVERAAIEHALEITHGNRTKAAELLGVNVRTIRRRLNGTSPKAGNKRTQSPNTMSIR